MKLFKIFVLLIFCPVLASAQNGSWWEPSLPTADDTITVFLDANINSEIPANVSSLVLHWGINEAGTGNWETPPQNLWPVGTILHSDQVAARSPMTNVSGSLWQVKLPTDATFRTIHYVINSGTPASPGSNWGHSDGGNNWNLTIFQSKITPVVLQPQIDRSFGDTRRSPLFVESQDTIHFLVTAVAGNSEVASIDFFLDIPEMKF